MDDDNLLERTQNVIQVERKLSALIDRVEPWITAAAATTDQSSSTGNKNQVHHYQTRVRPIPTNMDQVETILALARQWSAKTSAPAGWDPSAPVIGFATPNPLPHQLRGGALAALQLERVQQDQRKQQQQEKLQQQQKAEQEQAAKQKEEEMKQQQQQQQGQEQEAINPKKRPMRPAAGQQQQQRARPRPPQERPEVTSMNLSDSSSDDDDDDDDSE